MMGYSRDSSSLPGRELYDAGGELALQELTRRKPILKNRTPPEVEAIIVELFAGPAGLARSASPMSFASSAIRFRRPGCAGSGSVMISETKKRLKALEAKVAQEGLVLTESQLVALEKAKSEKEAHGEFESRCPGPSGPRIRSTSAT